MFAIIAAPVGSVVANRSVHGNALILLHDVVLCAEPQTCPFSLRRLNGPSTNETSLFAPCSSRFWALRSQRWRSSRSSRKDRPRLKIALTTQNVLSVLKTPKQRQPQGEISAKRMHELQVLTTIVRRTLVFGHKVASAKKILLAW